jgi:uncharacterized membrane protein
MTERFTRSPLLVPAGFAVLTVALQIAYPLLHGSGRDRLTVAIVVSFACASTTHALVTRGVRVAGAVVGIAAVIGFCAEVVGVHTGVPFGRYAYSSSLGVRIAGVPVLIALAWLMFAWPAALVARLVARQYGARVVVGAWLLTSWDLFLDPQMVAAGHWSWRDPGVHLPGVPSVPLTNYLGWLVVSLIVCAGIQAVLPDDPRDDRIPVAMVLWTYFSSVLALSVFLQLAGAAAWGAVGMGLVLGPLIWSLTTQARR